jgi:hypothetical protein
MPYLTKGCYQVVDWNSATSFTYKGYRGFPFNQAISKHDGQEFPGLCASWVSAFCCRQEIADVSFSVFSQPCLFKNDEKQARTRVRIRRLSEHLNAVLLVKLSTSTHKLKDPASAGFNPLETGPIFEVRGIMGRKRHGRWTCMGALW